MLGVLAKYIKDVSVVRRLLFAVVFLNPDLPMYWEVVIEFATAGKVSKLSVTPDQVRALIKNIETLDATAFQTDDALQKEMIFCSMSGKKPLGVPLISPSTSCSLCGTRLQIRRQTLSSWFFTTLNMELFQVHILINSVPKGRARSSNTMVTTVPTTKSFSILIGTLSNISSHLETLVFAGITAKRGRKCLDRAAQFSSSKQVYTITLMGTKP